MNIMLTVTGTTNRDRFVVWPEGWPIPKVGDDVDIPDLPEVNSVRSVVWYPTGSEEQSEPFVYIVLGPRRK